MPRPAKHAHAQILDAAAAIVSRRGPNAATVNAIAHAIGAPNGSIYHRFRTRDELLGRLWLRTAARFQDAFAEELKRPDAMQAGLHAALSIARVARLDAEAAGIMLLYRREDFLSGAWSRELTAEADGREVLSRTIAPGQGLPLRLSAGLREPRVFRFTLSRSFVPKHLGLSADRRELGIVAVFPGD